ncbi:MAG: RNA 2',3'-cyclic phosphodiesterase [Thermodesulfobacteria bacterium]|nr:RNA 2',3'-cyclic phosphodiesterase [Thermodesulfobacteriota bacterium]
MIRCFLAINLSNETERYLSKTINECRPWFGKRVRWVRPENCHLTLKFLGDVEESALSSIDNAVKGVVSGYKDFEIGLGRAGVFPHQRSPRVLWLGLTGELNTLGRLQRDIDLSLAPLGFEPEKRTFVPHITLGRVKGGRGPLVDIQKFLKIDPPDLKTHVQKVHLYQSILKPSGAEYRPLATFPLKDSQ